MFKALVSKYIDVTVPVIDEEVTVCLQELIPKPIDKQFEEVLVKVNKAKSDLETIDPVVASSIMRDVDLYTETKKELKREHKFEVSTNASLKMLEMIVHHNLLEKILERKDKFFVFHNAELPGAFIMATSKFVQHKYPDRKDVYDWRASSYYPDAARESGDPTILGDIYKIYANNREKWLMGPKPNGLMSNVEISGNVIERGVLVKISETIQSLGGVDLYTSDIGIDVSKDFNSQEEMTSILNFGQIICGLMTLTDLGTLIVKTYTFTKQFSRSLICLLTALFDKVHITKPTTSRPGNSEVYLVAEGFRKASFTPEVRDRLLDLLDFYKEQKTDPTTFGPIVDLDEKVDKVILRAAKLIHSGQQVRVLKTIKQLSLVYKDNLKKLSRDIYHLKKQKAREFIELI